MYNKSLPLGRERSGNQLLKQFAIATSFFCSVSRCVASGSRVSLGSVALGHTPFRGFDNVDFSSDFLRRVGRCILVHIVLSSRCCRSLDGVFEQLCICVIALLHLEFLGRQDLQQSVSMLEKATHVLYLQNCKLCAGEETITDKLESALLPHQSLQLS